MLEANSGVLVLGRHDYMNLQSPSIWDGWGDDAMSLDS